MQQTQQQGKLRRRNRRMPKRISPYKLRVAQQSQSKMASCEIETLTCALSELSTTKPLSWLFMMYIFVVVVFFGGFLFVFLFLYKDITYFLILSITSRPIHD